MYIYIYLIYSKYLIRLTSSSSDQHPLLHSDSQSLIVQYGLRVIMRPLAAVSNAPCTLCKWWQLWPRDCRQTRHNQGTISNPLYKSIQLIDIPKTNLRNQGAVGTCSSAMRHFVHLVCKIWLRPFLSATLQINAPVSLRWSRVLL